MLFLTKCLKQSSISSLFSLIKKSLKNNVFQHYISKTINLKMSMSHLRLEICLKIPPHNRLEREQSPLLQCCTINSSVFFFVGMLSPPQTRRRLDWWRCQSNPSLWTNIQIRSLLVSDSIGQVLARALARKEV